MVHSSNLSIVNIDVKEAAHRVRGSLPEAEVALEVNEGWRLATRPANRVVTRFPNSQSPALMLAGVTQGWLVPVTGRKKRH